MNSSNTDDSRPPADVTSAEAPEVKFGLPLWIMTGMVSVAVLSASAAFTPTVMKRIVLFYLVYGIACGYVLNWLANEFRPRPRFSVVVLTGMMTFFGAMNVGYLSYRHFEQARLEQARQRPQDLEILKTLELASRGDPEIAEQYAQEIRQYTPRFSDYLQNRVAGIGNLKHPWPLIIWVIEISLASVASVVSFLKFRQATQLNSST